MPFWMRRMAAFHFQHSTFCQAAVVWPQPTFGSFGCSPLVPRCRLSVLHTAPHPRRASAARLSSSTRRGTPHRRHFPLQPQSLRASPASRRCSAPAGSGCGGAAVLPPGVAPGCGGTVGYPPASLRGWVVGWAGKLLFAPRSPCRGM